MSEYIAEFKAPKQRITRPFGYVIRQEKAGDENSFTVHRKYYDTMGGYSDGEYRMTYEEAAKYFADKVRNHVLDYPPSVFDTTR